MAADAPDVIGARADTERLAASLVSKAGMLARARALLAARAEDAGQWRKAAWLWPLLGQE